MDLKVTVLSKVDVMSKINKISKMSKIEKMANCPPGADFVFKLPNGTVLAKAKNMKQFTILIAGLPYAAVEYHAKGKHFSPWIEMMGEKEIAHKMLNMNTSSNTLRSDLIKILGSDLI